MVKEPAKKSYWFGRAYSDLFHTIIRSFMYDVRVIKEDWGKICDAFSNFRFVSIFHGLINLLSILFIAVFGFAFTLILSVIHISIVAVIMCLVYIGFMFVWMVDAIYRMIHGISYNCPHCQHKIALPTYVCPHCGAEHRRLIPSKYGIFHRICECGHTLPTTFINGRQKLESKCPKCGEPLLQGVSRAYQIPVIGGANSGKTCFINAGIQKIEETAKGYGLNFHYEVLQGDTLDDYNANKERMARGFVPEKTSDMRMRFYNFFLNGVGDKIENQISICDIAGESFESAENTQNQEGYRFSDGMFIIIDPFSIPDFNEKAKEEMGDDYQYVNCSTQNVSDVFNITNIAIERIRHSSKKARELVAAVVFVKTDIPYVNDIVGENAIQKMMADNPSLGYEEASNRVAEEFFSSYGENSMLLELQNKFSKIGFFSVSALGRNDFERKSFESVNVDKPMYWLLENITNIRRKKVKSA